MFIKFRQNTVQTLYRLQPFTTIALRSFSAQAQRQVSSNDNSNLLSSRLPSDPQSSLFHRQVDVILRDGNKREKNAIRRQRLWCVSSLNLHIYLFQLQQRTNFFLTPHTFSFSHSRIPSCLQGRGKVPDLLINVPIDPILQDLHNRLFAPQKLGKVKWSGPLYQLQLLPDPSGAPSPLPVQTIRVKPHNMQLNQITEVPKTIAFMYCPEEEPVRVRIPIRYINEEKCPGLKEGGWLNCIIPAIDINVAPFTRAPLFATLDIGNLHLKDRKTVADLQFEGKGDGCRTILADDLVTTVISKV